MLAKKRNLISFVLTLFVISLLFLSGPVAAVTVSLTQPNNANKGSNVSFTIKVDINDPDAYVPIKYANIILNGPNSYSMVCKVNMDGTYNCPGVSVSVQNNLGYGYGYGYDSALSYGYSFGYGYGYSNSITYTVTLSTSGLNSGTYTAQADVYAEGDISHDYSSNKKTFKIFSYTPASCVENWQCGSWEECLPSNTEIRSCVDLNKCGTTHNKPPETASCVFEEETVEDTGNDRDTSHIQPPPGDLTFPDKSRVLEARTAPTLMKELVNIIPKWDSLSLLQKLLILNTTSLLTAFVVLYNPIKDYL